MFQPHIAAAVLERPHLHRFGEFVGDIEGEQGGGAIGPWTFRPGDMPRLRVVLLSKVLILQIPP